MGKHKTLKPVFCNLHRKISPLGAYKTSAIVCKLIMIRLIPLTPLLPWHFTIPLKGLFH